MDYNNADNRSDADTGKSADTNGNASDNGKSASDAPHQGHRRNRQQPRCAPWRNRNAHRRPRRNRHRQHQSAHVALSIPKPPT